jgi:PPE-repeat protein
VAWATTTATQAEQTASQARAAAAAYEAAHAATVPPAAVAANRAQLMVLVATNFFGQNAPAIAANETAYSEMWAQDAAAMHGYAEAAAPAASLTPFDQAPQTTNAGGQAAQNAAVAHATGTPVVENTQTSLSQAFSAVPQQMQIALPPHSVSPPPPPGSSGEGSSPGFFHALSTLTYGPNQLVQAPHTVADVSQLASGFPGLAPSAGLISSGSAMGTGSAPGVLVNTPAAGSVGGPGAVLASAGKGVPVGNLSAPQGWSMATQAASHEPSPLQVSKTGFQAAAGEASNAPKPMTGQTPASAMGPMQNLAHRLTGTLLTRMRDRRFEMPRPPAAG